MYVKPLKELSVSCPFGYVFPWNNKRHLGVDFACQPGTPIYAIGSGTILGVGFEKDGLGRFIKLQTTEHLIIYAHVSAMRVSAGESVSAGQQIGSSGDSGETTGPHLHMEIQTDGTPIDPLLLINA